MTILNCPDTIYHSLPPLFHPLVAKLSHPLVAASQLHPVDVAQPEHNQYTLCGHLRTSSAGSHCHCAQRCCAGAAPQQRRRCSSVAPAASPAHKAQLTTALMAQGWCHESVDIATAQGAVQQLRATVPHRSSVAAAAVSPLALQRRRCTKRMWTTGLHSWHKLTGVRIHCHCTRCCAAPEGYLSTAMFATSTGVQLSCNLS